MASAAQAYVGPWTYRSFLNNPAPLGDDPQAALDLIFGEGVLTVSAAEPGDSGFEATLSFGGDAIMDLAGSFEPGAGGAPAIISARGQGRPGSPISDFRYDYIFYAVPDWPDGVGQVQALVGTVIRAADHGSAKKGAVASTVTVRAG